MSIWETGRFGEEELGMHAAREDERGRTYIWVSTSAIRLGSSQDKSLVRRSRMTLVSLWQTTVATSLQSVALYLK